MLITRCIWASIYLVQLCSSSESITSVNITKAVFLFTLVPCPCSQKWSISNWHVPPGPPICSLLILPVSEVSFTVKKDLALGLWSGPISCLVHKESQKLSILLLVSLLIVLITFYCSLYSSSCLHSFYKRKIKNESTTIVYLCLLIQLFFIFLSSISPTPHPARGWTRDLVCM